MRIGIYNRWLHTLGGGERHSLAIASLLRKTHDLVVISDTLIDPDVVANRLHLDLDGVQFVCMDFAQIAAHSAHYDLFVNASHGVYFPNRARRGALLVFFPAKVPTGVGARIRPWAARQMQTWIPAPLYALLFRHWFRGLGVRLQHPMSSDLLEQLATYDQVWANSRFTQHWIQNYWRRTSCLLYPPVATTLFQPDLKRKQILSVGRFFSGHHSKKHEVMVRAFRELLQEGLTGWELHLVGGTFAEPVHQAYLARIRKLAQGAPIVLHTDVPFIRLRELYASSAIYWHAAGYGESETATPERLEHFGMSTVEAMAAGAAPVVMGRGGQTELIDHGVDGFLWYTTDQLKTYTLGLARDLAARERMGSAARLRSRQFDEDAFQRRLRVALTALGVEM